MAMESTKVNWRHSILFLLVAAIVLVADQVTKSLIRTNMTLGQSIPVEGRFRLSYSTNSGGIFSLPLNSTVLLVLAVIVVAIIIWLYFRHLYKRGKLLRFGLGLVLSGAGGNLIDRIRFGEVTDFIDVRLWGDFHWPTFNVADASLSIGIFVLIYCILIMAKNIE